VLAFLDPRTGELLRTVSGTALARAAPGATHWLDENAHVLGSNVVVTSASHLFLIDSATGRVRRALPFGPHLPFSTLLPDGRLAAPVDDTSTRLIDPRTGRQRRPQRRRRRRLRRRAADHHRERIGLHDRGGVFLAPAPQSAVAPGRPAGPGPGLCSRGGVPSPRRGRGCPRRGHPGAPRGHSRAGADPGRPQRSGAGDRTRGARPRPAVDRRTRRHGRCVRPLRRPWGAPHARAADPGRCRHGNGGRGRAGGALRRPPQHRAHDGPLDRPRPARRAEGAPGMPVPAHRGCPEPGRSHRSDRCREVHRRLRRRGDRQRTRRGVGRPRAGREPVRSPRRGRRPGWG
jgi:hypothetical protein